MAPERIINWSIERIEIPFRKPFTILSGKNTVTLKTRAIALLKVALASGETLIGEAHPLPGLHQETLEFCMQELETFLQSERNIPFDPERLTKLSGPSVVAIEALFLPKLFPCPAQVTSQALLVPGEQHPRTLNLRAHNFIKIKLGRLDFERELDWAMTLHEVLAPHVRWRLDGNQQLTMAQLEKLATMPFQGRIDYIEEPLADFYHTLASKQFSLSPLPFALDESLPMVLKNGLDLTQQKALGLKAFIIRPPSLGGYSAAISAIKLADSFNLLSVLSSSFEGPWGFESLLRLLSIPSQSLLRAQAHGLDTFSLLNLDQLHATIPNIPVINS